MYYNSSFDLNDILLRHTYFSFALFFFACSEALCINDEWSNLDYFFDLDFIQTSIIHKICVKKSSSTQIMSKRICKNRNLKNTIDFINHTFINIYRIVFSLTHYYAHEIERQAILIKTPLGHHERF